MTDFEKMASPEGKPAENIPEMVNLFYDDLISGRYGTPKAVGLSLVTEEGNLKVFLWGGKTGTIVELAGIFALSVAECHAIVQERKEE
jgi:hypothetical protein